jgi:hypothetical protein
MKFSIILLTLISTLSAITINKTLSKYKTNTFFDLREIEINNVKEIIGKDNTCVLFKDNTNLYCVLKDKRKIKLKLKLKNDNIIELLIINSKYLNKKELSLGKTITEKYAICTKENEKLQTEVIISQNKVESLETTKEENNNALKFLQNEIKIYKKKISFLNQKKDKTVRDIEKKCQVERTEIISIMGGKLYKDVKEYSIESQLLIELERMRNNIKKLQSEFLEILKKNENLNRKIKNIKNNNINSSSFIE